MSIFSKRLNYALTKNKLRQSDLVEATGYSRSRISTYAKGIASPPLEVVGVIADALRVDKWWLMGCDELSEALRSLNQQLQQLDDEDIKKVAYFIEFIIYQKNKDFSDNGPKVFK